MSTAIKVENLSKIYRLGEIGTGTISRDLERWFKMRVLQQEDPFLKIGESNDRSKKGSSDLVYSLKDINFEIAQGDAVGIIGRNGAGKSTLLKILSRVTTPSTGKINIKGRVASLLEVGTGFHPELTGRENIYLNGAILGMRKKEIDRKLDEIIDFSGVERYIDTPVKRYSSGMYVRLAFAVAAHLESEILIVDEVLAVGDAEFQKKCLGKMGEVSKGEGRTVLFVSHNIDAVNEFCNKGIHLNNGSIQNKGDIITVLSSFSSFHKKSDVLKVVYKEREQIIRCNLINGNVRRGDDIIFKISFENYSNIRGEELAFFLINDKDEKLTYFSFLLKSASKIDVLINSKNLLPGSYKISFFGHIPNQSMTFTMPELIDINILPFNQLDLADISIKRRHAKFLLDVEIVHS